MKKIPLTQGYEAIVDDGDYEYLMQWKWYVNKRHHVVYAVRDIRVDGKKKSIWMHRLINNTPDGLFTDHINGDGLENRRNNLRTATHQENMINCARWKSGSSKYRGVSWHKTNERWYAQITIDYKNIYIGSFDTEQKARAAYEKFRDRVRHNQIFRREANG